MRLDRYVTKTVPALPPSLAQKYIRIKRIKVGGRKSSRDYRLINGDLIEMYINDEYFDNSEDKAYLKLTNSDINIIYEDENILVINKPAGLLCHSAEGWYPDTLVTRLQAYLYKKGEWHPRETNAFTPALCNRIDRNTEGLVIAAKNALALRIICEKLRLNEIDKYYQAVVHGIPKNPASTLEGYIFKDAVKNRVYVKKERIPGAKTAIMEYQVLETNKVKNLSLLECRLITGRTHQIRAQLASIGHPILGDGKYGRGDLDKPYKEKKQALCSYKIIFSFKTDAGILEYLDGQEIQVKTKIFDKYSGNNV